MYTPILMHEINWKQLHDILLNFPILLFSAALVCDLLNGIGKTKALHVGHWLVILGAAFCLPTVLTGIGAAQHIDSMNQNLFIHKWLGFATTIFAIFYAICRTAALCGKGIFHPYIYIGLSVLLVALNLWTSDYGELISRKTTSLESTKQNKNL